MKRSLSLFAMLLCALVMTAALAREVAACRGVHAVHQIGGGGASCTMTGMDADWCYYDCECWGVSASRCEELLTSMGMEAY
jgi:hypothetical protein